MEMQESLFGYKMKYKKLHLRGCVLFVIFFGGVVLFYMMNVIKHWNRLPR